MDEFISKYWLTIILSAIILGAVGKISRNRKHKQFFDKIILKKLERIAYVKQIISQTNFKLLVE